MRPRTSRVRWLLAVAGWRRSDPWMTSFVDADTTRPGVLLGPVPGRSGACVRKWLGFQSPEFRAGIEIAVIDPSAPYASGIRAALPHARIAIDGWHLVRLANQTVTEVRQRVTREWLGRRGRATDPMWTLLLPRTSSVQLRRHVRTRRGCRRVDPVFGCSGGRACPDHLSAWATGAAGRHSRCPGEADGRCCDTKSRVVSEFVKEARRMSMT